MNAVSFPSVTMVDPRASLFESLADQGLEMSEVSIISPFQIEV